MNLRILCFEFHDNAILQLCLHDIVLAIAVIAVAPTGKAFYVYSYVQTRLMGQYNGE